MSIDSNHNLVSVRKSAAKQPSSHNSTPTLAHTRLASKTPLLLPLSNLLILRGKNGYYLLYLARIVFGYECSRGILEEDYHMFVVVSSRYTYIHTIATGYTIVFGNAKLCYCLIAPKIILDNVQYSL
jgi:hypothetical protein